MVVVRLLLMVKKKLSCNLLAIECKKKEIVTVEGLQIDSELNQVQEAFRKFNAAQCGFFVLMGLL